MPEKHVGHRVSSDIWEKKKKPAKLNTSERPGAERLPRLAALVSNWQFRRRTRERVFLPGSLHLNHLDHCRLKTKKQKTFARLADICTHCTVRGRTADIIQPLYRREMSEIVQLQLDSLYSCWMSRHKTATLTNDFEASTSKNSVCDSHAVVAFTAKCHCCVCSRGGEGELSSESSWFIVSDS